MTTNGKTAEEKAEAAAAKAAATAKAKVLREAKAADAKKAKAADAKAKAMEKAKEKKEAAVAAKQATTLRKLAPLAKEINYRLEKADKMEDDAYDHRLSAAITLAEAKKTTTGTGVGFAAWAEETIGRPYNTIRKLVSVGNSPNPQQALEDLRGRNKEDNKKLREKKKLTSREVTGDKPKAETPAARITSGFKALKDTEEGAKLAASHVESFGLVAVTKEEAKAARLAGEAAQHGPYDQIVALFDNAEAAVKMQVVNYVVAAVGASLANGFTAPANGADTGEEIDPLAIPEHLKREVKTGSRRKSVAAN
tara:strand:+ start:3232 stop:4158 length:927 start_codon:yes stop_codon:yes gene_type:complete